MKSVFFRSAVANCIVLFAVRGMAQEAAGTEALEKRFKQLDKNADGRITTDELPPSSFFKQRDLNQDGAITLAEAQAFFASEGRAAAEANAGKMRPAPADVKSTRAPDQRVQPLRGGDCGVGQMVADATFKDLAGTSHKLSSLAKQRAVVIAVTSTSCPLSKKYLPTLANLAKSYSRRGVAWVVVNPIATDKPADIQTAAQALAGNAIYVHDRNRSLTNALGARTTTDVIVLDAARTIVFHGAIDDQYGLGFSTDAPRHRYLADALDAILANKQPLVTATGAPGCALEAAQAPAEETAITYHNRISRIVQNHCVECHREGGVAPFSLATHADVAAHAAMIKQVVEGGTMPPWLAGPLSKAQEGAGHSLWSNDRSLADDDRTVLLAWLDGNKPLGNEGDAPRPRSFATGWSIGKPDAIFEFAKPVAIKATGVMPYQNVVMETKLTEDKWVQAIEVQPGDRTVVHHMVVYLQSADKEQMTVHDEAADERAGFWAVYVPGNATLSYPQGFAKLLPRGANLRCQIHYTPSGTATTDLSRIGIVFAKQAPRHEVRALGICNVKIAIPPGEANHREDAVIRLPFDIEVLSFLPHMHARAKACRYNLIQRNGDARILLDIPRYDFNWQLLYRYHQPQRIARGDAIKFSAWYDNSAKNPANPDPTQTIRWGKQTSDEMHLGYLEYFIPNQESDKSLPPAGRQRGRR